MIRLLSVVILCTLSITARADSMGPTPHSSAGDGSGLTERSASDEAILDGNRLRVEVQSMFDEPVTFGIQATASAGWRVSHSHGESFELADSADAAVLEFDLVRDGAKSAEGDVVVLQVRFPAVRRPEGHTLRKYYRFERGALTQIDFDEYMDSQAADPRTPEILKFQGVIVPRAFDAYTPEERDWLAAELASLETQAVSSALTTSAISDPTLNEDADAGCIGGGGASAGILLGLIVLFLRRRATGAVAGFVLIATVSSAVPSKAVTHCGAGFLVFWDTRANFDNTDYVTANFTGWRLRTCNTADLTCSPTVNDNCCFSSLSEVKLQLVRKTGGTNTIVHTTTTTSAGQFAVCDTGWVAGATYDLIVTYSSSDAPGAFSIAPTSGLGVNGITIPLGTLPSAQPTPNNVGQISVNGTNDTTSAGGDHASMYQIMFDSMQRLTNEGETRYRKTFGSPNTFDSVKIRYDATGCGMIVSQTEFRIGVNCARGTAIPHEFYHIWQGRVFNRWLFTENPASLDPNWPGTGEGVALNEGFADLGTWAYLADPATANVGDIVSNLYGCQGPSVYQANDSANRMNGSYALWDLIDSTTAGEDVGTDASDVTLKQLMDALVTMNGVNTGLDGAINEATFTVLGTTCAGRSTDNCLLGQVCKSNPVGGPYFCVSGDVHGENLEDWITHLGGQSYATHLATLQSSPCLGGADNTDGDGLTGGFRTD